MRATQLTLGAVLLCACALGPAHAGPKQKPPKKPRPGEAEVIKEGQIRVVRGLRGGEAQLTDQKGKRYLCTGPAREELLRLGGHRVKARGMVGPKKLMVPTFKVHGYEMLAINGRKPVVGRLHRSATRGYTLRRETGDLTVKVSKAFRRLLKRRVGCKIWLLGEIQGQQIKAFKFGWLTCKPATVIKPEKESSK